MSTRLRWSTWSLVVLLVASMALPVRAGQKDFSLPEQEFFDRVHTVIILPYRMPSDFARSDTLSARAEVLKTRLDTLLVAGLEEAGIHAIPASVADSLWRQFADSLGNVYDPLTGAPDTAKIVLANFRTRCELIVRHHPDAWVNARVLYVPAYFDHGTATWDGVHQEMAKVGGFFRLMSGKSDVNKAGTIPALSLYLSIVDPDGQWLYIRGGGLQVVARLEKGKFVDLPPDEYFADRAQSQKAVEKALEKVTKYAQKHPRGRS